MNKNENLIEKVVLRFTVYILISIAILLFWITKKITLPSVILILIYRLENWTNKELKINIIPKIKLESIEKYKLLRAYKMALTTEWSIVLIIVSIIALTFTDASINFLLYTPLSKNEMKSSKGIITKIEEGRTGPTSSNKDYIHIHTESNKDIKLYSIFTQRQIEQLQETKTNKEKVIFFYKEEGLFTQSHLWEITSSHTTIQKYNENLVKRRYKQNNKILTFLSIYIISTYTFITIYFYRKTKPA